MHFSEGVRPFNLESVELSRTAEYTEKACSQTGEACVVGLALEQVIELLSVLLERLGIEVEVSFFAVIFRKKSRSLVERIRRLLLTRSTVHTSVEHFFARYNGVKFNRASFADGVNERELIGFVDVNFARVDEEVNLTSACVLAYEYRTTSLGELTDIEASSFSSAELCRTVNEQRVVSGRELDRQAVGAVVCKEHVARYIKRKSHVAEYRVGSTIELDAVDSAVETVFQYIYATSEFVELRLDGIDTVGESIDTTVEKIEVVLASLDFIGQVRLKGENGCRVVVNLDLKRINGSTNSFVGVLEGRIQVCLCQRVNGGNLICKQSERIAMLLHVELECFNLSRVSFSKRECSRSIGECLCGCLFYNRHAVLKVLNIGLERTDLRVYNSGVSNQSGHLIGKREDRCRVGSY